MSDTNLRRGKLIPSACAALWLTCMVGAALPAEPLESSFKVLGPIPSDFKHSGFYRSAADFYDPYGHLSDIFGSRGCLSARAYVYRNLKDWQYNMHARLGENVRHAIKNAEKEKAATKDPKRKKQIGEWEGRLSVAVQKMYQQIDDEYPAEIKNVHFSIRCSNK